MNLPADVQAAFWKLPAGSRRDRGIARPAMAVERSCPRAMGDNSRRRAALDCLPAQAAGAKVWLQRPAHVVNGTYTHLPSATCASVGLTPETRCRPSSLLCTYHCSPNSGQHLPLRYMTAGRSCMLVQATCTSCRRRLAKRAHCQGAQGVESTPLPKKPQQVGTQRGMRRIAPRQSHLCRAWGGSTARHRHVTACLPAQQASSTALTARNQAAPAPQGHAGMLKRRPTSSSVTRASAASTRSEAAASCSST